MENQYPPSVGKVLLSWHGPEHVHVHPNPRAVLIAFVLLVAIVAYAVISNNPIMAITFILIGLVGYLFLTKDPRSHDFAITTRGVVAGQRMFPYDTVESFWIFEEDPLENVLSLKTETLFSPTVHVPLPAERIGEVHQIVSTYLPEERQEPRAVDILEKMLHH